LGQIKTSAEMRAMPEQHGSLGFALGTGNGFGQLFDAAVVHGVALVGPVEPDLGHIAYQFISNECACPDSHQQPPLDGGAIWLSPIAPLFDRLQVDSFLVNKITSE